MSRSKSVPKKMQINRLESMVADVAKTNLELFPEVETFINKTLSDYNTLKLNQTPEKSTRSNTTTKRSHSSEATLGTKRFRSVDGTLHVPPPGSVTWATDESKEAKTTAVNALLRLDGLATEDGVLQFRLIQDGKPNDEDRVGGQRINTVVKDGVNRKDQGTEAKVSCRDAATSPLPRSTVIDETMSMPTTKTTKSGEDKATNTDYRNRVLTVNHIYPQLQWPHAPNERRHEHAPQVNPQVQAGVGHNYNAPQPVPPRPNMYPGQRPPAQNPNQMYRPNGMPNTTERPVHPPMPSPGPPRMPHQPIRPPYQPNDQLRPPFQPGNPPPRFPRGQHYHYPPNRWPF